MYEREYVRDLKKIHPDKPKNCLHCQLFKYCEQDEYMQMAQQLNSGDSGKTVLFIGETPEYDRTTLKKYIDRHLKDHSVWITTALKCPVGKITIKKEFINQCSKFTKEDIDNIDPDVVISLGTWALETYKEVSNETN